MMSGARAITMLAAALSAAACTSTDRAPAADAAQRTDSAGQLAPAAAVESGAVNGDSAIKAAAPPKTAGNSAAPSAAREEAATPRAKTAPRRVEVGGVDLTGLGYDVGNPAAPVVLVNFSDFGCPYCGSFARETYPAIEREYVRTGKVFFKYVPFALGMFPNGAEAARAAECAADAGRFWPMHDSLYANQPEWKKARAPVGIFQRYAAGLGLERRHFAACYADREVHTRTRRNNEAAEALGIRVTPSFLVNDRPIEGALPIADFRRVIDAALLLEEARR